MTGSEYIAEFLARHNARNVFVLNGGACAFMIDAVARHPQLNYFCFQNEQAAAMAADAVWRVDRSIGVTMATSGPGATNLITGIACSYFDSIPSLHITGQVNKRETDVYRGAHVRQAGFQETKIVEMVRPITKYAAQATDAESLRQVLAEAMRAATSGRMGPALIDVPIDIQQLDVGDEIEMAEPSTLERGLNTISGEMEIVEKLNRLLSSAQRPLVLLGAGLGLAGVGEEVTEWLEKNGIPFVSSWNGITYFNHDSRSYVGQIGVYGNRGANFVLQNADTLIVLGSRLDNRQRSGNASRFAPFASVYVIDLDREELRKYEADGYETSELHLAALPPLLERVRKPAPNNAWLDYVSEMKNKFYGRDLSGPDECPAMSPYAAIQRLNALISPDAIITVDTGATVCWFHQMFHRTQQIIMTAGGHSPMGYALPAVIGSALCAPERQLICVIGDGGFQLNIQELQTIRAYGLDVKIIVFDNAGYGIIKQFQDSYLESRYEASGKGYSVPDLQKVAAAYGIDYAAVDQIDQIGPDLLAKGARLIHLKFHPNTLIVPKLEMGRPIHDQFPYLSDEEFRSFNRFTSFPRQQVGGAPK